MAESSSRSMRIARPDPGRSLSAAQGLVQSNGVFAVVNASASSPPMFSYLAQAKIPVVSNYVLTSSFASAPNLFTPSGSWNPASGGGSSSRPDSSSCCSSRP